MVRETWQCQKCGNEIYFLVKWHFKKNPLSKKCECGGLWKFKPIVKKRKNMDIWRSIHDLLGLDFDDYNKRINYANLTQENLLKLEKAIKEKLKC